MQVFRGFDATWSIAFNWPSFEQPFVGQTLYCATLHMVLHSTSLCATLHRRKWLSRLYLINSVLLDSIFPTKSFWIVCWGKNTFYLVHLKQIEAKISCILIKASTYTLGDSRKYPYHTTDGFHILPPFPSFGISKMRYPPMPLDFHNRKPPLTFGFSIFFVKPFGITCSVH